MRLLAILIICVNFISFSYAMGEKYSEPPAFDLRKLEISKDSASLYYRHGDCKNPKDKDCVTEIYDLNDEKIRKMLYDKNFICVKRELL